ncbi:hypothetical protein [Polaribacter sp.]|uniref:hypothetical protein n=1 Tax=Polaribacter sp. TaxID=1920175 RepID=UPI003F6B25BE
MKSQFNTLFFLCSLAILMYSCKTECEHAKDVSCYPNHSKPAQIITYEEMADMMDAYEKGAKKELNKYIKKESKGKDSVSTVYNWYKLEDLKQYIAYIERISKEKDIPVTGFRIYPTQYSKKYKKKELRNRNTIIFTPTTTIDGKDDAAFEPLYSTKGKPVGITQYLEKVKAKKVNKASMLNLNFQNGLESSSANRMQPTPPY